MWVEVDWLQALLGAVLFIVFVHGFVSGQRL